MNPVLLQDFRRSDAIIDTDGNSHRRPLLDETCTALQKQQFLKGGVAVVLNIPKISGGGGSGQFCVYFWRLASGMCFRHASGVPPPSQSRGDCKRPRLSLRALLTACDSPPDGLSRPSASYRAHHSLKGPPRLR